MDFTLTKYRQLLVALQQADFAFVLRFSDDNAHRQVILRHDVDLKPQNSLRIAQIEAELDLHAIYYFRMIPESYDESIIKQIAALGHEIGYHYECLTTVQGDMEAAYQDFCHNLQSFNNLITSIFDSQYGRRQCSVTTICMHGSPRSAFDSRDIWKKYDYHLLGIDFEPYLDTDWSRILYLTDTGRQWDGYKVSVRDKIPNWQERWESEGLSFHTTDDVINRIPTIPYNLMITTHPQRWNEIGLAWVQELILQNAKNIVKQHIVHHQC